jgi:multidrug resistance efflux pump/preprotein translocase subunit SecF
MKKGKLFFWTLIVALVLVLAYVKYSKNKETQAKMIPMGKGGPQTLRASGFVIEYSKLSNTLSANGSVLAQDEVQLQPEVSGRVTYLNIKEGSIVSKGTLLLKINDADLKAQLAKLNTQIKIAQANLNRLAELIKINGVSQAEYDAAENTVNNIKADMQILQVQIDKTELRAPFTGKLGLRNISLGAMVSPSTIIASLQNISQLKMDISLPEKYASVIHIGDKLQCTIAGMDTPFSASIFAIEPQIDEMTRNLTVRALNMGLPSVSLRRPVFAIVMNVIIILFGVIGYTFLGVREYPSIDPPVITVRTNYTGANADIIESQITEPLENAINGVQGIRTISSASNQGSSNITVEFDLSADLETAANDVRDKVSQALRLLPQDIDAAPVVSKADANSDAIISMTVQSESKNVLELTDYAVNVLQQRLQTIPGVSTIQIWGQKNYAMRLWFDPQKLAAYQLTAIDVQNALNRTNVELPSGKISGTSTELTVNTLGRINTEEEFNNIIIKDVNGQTVRLKDVGYAVLGTENFETSLRESAVGMVALALVPQPGANYVEISDEFYKRLEEIKKEVPKDVKLNIALDNTVFVKNSILEVKETLFISIVLVVLIIYLFFRDWIIALRPLIDIPVSLIGAFFIMYLFGFTINVLTLLAIVLATGLVVDDGIVVTENIFKKLESGMPKMQAAREGSEEIFFAVMSTSITLAIVFLPIVLCKVLSEACLKNLEL